jgi:hypothetical protein
MGTAGMDWGLVADCGEGERDLQVQKNGLLVPFAIHTSRLYLAYSNSRRIFVSISYLSTRTRKQAIECKLLL